MMGNYLKLQECFESIVILLDLGEIKEEKENLCFLKQETNHVNGVKMIKMEIIEYYFDHGESAINARRKLVIHLLHL